MSRRTAVERVLADAAPALLGYFLRRIEAAEDAADLVGETLAAVWRSARRMPSDPEAARMWCFGVARNVLRNYERGRRRRDALADRVRESIALAGTPAFSDEELDLRAAIAALPPELAELIRLVHWDGFTVAEAADLLGVPASTARSQHARAKLLLREALAPDPALPLPSDPSQTAASARTPARKRAEESAPG